MAGTDSVEDGVQQGPKAMLPGMARRGWWRQERAHHLPFSVRKRREIGMSVHASRLLDPGKFSRPSFQTRS